MIRFIYLKFDKGMNYIFSNTDGDIIFPLMLFRSIIFGLICFVVKCSGYGHLTPAWVKLAVFPFWMEILMFVCLLFLIIVSLGVFEVIDRLLQIFHLYRSRTKFAYIFTITKSKREIIRKFNPRFSKNFNEDGKYKKRKK